MTHRRVRRGEPVAEQFPGLPASEIEAIEKIRAGLRRSDFQLDVRTEESDPGRGYVTEIDVDVSDSSDQSPPPRGDFPVAAVCGLEHLKRLGLGMLDLPSLPACLGDLRELEEIDVWANQLTELPQSLARLPRLKSVSANANRIRRLDLQDFPSLEVIDLSGNDEIEVSVRDLQGPQLKRVFLDRLPSDFSSSCVTPAGTDIYHWPPQPEVPLLGGGQVVSGCEPIDYDRFALVARTDPARAAALTNAAVESSPEIAIERGWAWIGQQPAAAQQTPSFRAVRDALTSHTFRGTSILP